MGEAAPAPPPFTGDAQLKSKLLIAASAFALVPIAAPASAQHQHMPGMPMPTQKHGTNKPAAKPGEQDETVTMEHGAPAPAEAAPAEHSHGEMPMPMAMEEHAGHSTAMSGALGPYPMERESSGTAWQPDTSEHMGLHVMSGDWTLMAHGVLNLVYDHQSGRRGD